VWINICTGCRYKEEIPGFEHKRGAIEQERHSKFDRIFAQVVGIEGTAHVIPPEGAPGFDVDFTYACVTCMPGLHIEKLHVTISGR